MTDTIAPRPRYQSSLREGEVDGRSFDCTPDLGPVGDVFTSISTLSLTITRRDGAAITSTDLQSAQAQWINTLDATGLIPTFGFYAPPGSAGVRYKLTLTADKTQQGRIFIRDWYMNVEGALG